MVADLQQAVNRKMRTKKPPMSFWTQAACTHFDFLNCSAFGHDPLSRGQAAQWGLYPLTIAPKSVTTVMGFISTGICRPFVVRIHLMVAPQALHRVMIAPPMEQGQA